MKCANHPDREAVAFCSECGKPLCEECIAYRDEKGHPYCAQCAIMLNAKTYEKTKPAGNTKKTNKGKHIGFWSFVVVGIILIIVEGFFYLKNRTSTKIISNNIQVQDSTEIKNVRLFFLGEAIVNYHARFKKYPVSLEDIRGNVIDSSLFDKLVDSSVSYSKNQKYGFILKITGDSTSIGNIVFVNSGPIPLSLIENH